MTPFPHCDQLADKTLNKMRDSRYAGFKESAIGKKIAAGKVHPLRLVTAQLGHHGKRCRRAPPCC